MGHQNSWTIAHEIKKLEVSLTLSLFELENRPVCPSGPTGSITKFFTNVCEKFWYKNARTSDHQNFMEAQESRQNGGLPASSSFELENELIFSSGPTDSIAKILTYVNEKFW